MARAGDDRGGPTQRGRAESTGREDGDAMLLGVKGGALVPMGEQEAPVGLQGAQTQERGRPSTRWQSRGDTSGDRTGETSRQPPRSGKSTAK